MKTTLKLDTAGGPPHLRVLFGHASIGRYRLWLYDAQGRNPKLLLDGASDDQRADELVLPSAPSLSRRLAFVQARVASASPSPDIVSVTLELAQDGALTAGGSLNHSATVGAGQEAMFNFAIRFA